MCAHTDLPSPCHYCRMVSRPDSVSGDDAPSLTTVLCSFCGVDVTAAEFVVLSYAPGAVRAVHRECMSARTIGKCAVCGFDIRNDEIIEIDVLDVRHDRCTSPLA